MQFAETVVKGPAGSLMNRLWSHRIVRACSERRCKGFRRVSEVDLVFEAHSCVRLTAKGGARSAAVDSSSNS